jgi:hypothetical protein
MWKNTVEPNRPQMTIWRTRLACCIRKARSTHSEYVILIAFPLQQWLHERASMLRYTYMDCLVQCCVRYDTCINPISCRLMRTIQLNSLNSKPNLYNVLELPPSKLICLQLQQHFWKLEIFFLPHKTPELWAEWQICGNSLAVAHFGTLSCWAQCMRPLVLLALSESFLISNAKLCYLLHPLLYFQRLFTVIVGKVSLLPSTLHSTQNHTHFMTSRLISHLCASVSRSPLYHWEQNNSSITWYARPQFPCWWCNHWLSPSMWLTRMWNFIKSEWH